MPWGVQKFVRIAAAILAVGLVGYAVLLASRPDPTESKDKSTTERARTPRARGNVGKGDTAAGKTARAANTGPTRAGEVDAAGAKVGGPPPAPEPIDYDETLKDLEAFVANLESMKERKQKLPQPEWVERYRLGNELVDNLMRSPDLKGDDRRRDEVVALNMRFRGIIQQILATPE